jgi:hypothetical protein
LRRRQPIHSRPPLGHHETAVRLIAALRLKQRHQRPLLGDGFHGFFVGRQLEVGEVVGVEVVVKVDVLIIVVVAAGA